MCSTHTQVLLDKARLLLHVAFFRLQLRLYGILIKQDAACRTRHCLHYNRLLQHAYKRLPVVSSATHGMLCISHWLQMTVWRLTALCSIWLLAWGGCDSISADTACKHRSMQVLWGYFYWCKMVQLLQNRLTAAQYDTEHA